MIIFFGGVFAFLAYLNPFLGVIYALGIVGDKILKTGKIKLFILSSLIFNFVLVTIGFADLEGFVATLSVIALIYFYYYTLLRYESYDVSLFYTIIAGFGLNVLQYYIFSEHYRKLVVGSIVIAKTFFEADNLSFLDVVQNIYLNNYAAITTVIMGAGIYLGSIILSKKKEIPSWEFRKVTFSKYLDYSLIVAFAFLIMNRDITVIISTNTLIVLTLLYFIVGIGVFFSVFRKFFEHFWIYYIIFALVLFLNSYSVVILAFIGLFDRWINFRKLIRGRD